MEQSFFYVAGITLVLLALIVSAIGLRTEDFPSRGALGAGLAVFAVLAVASAAGAVINARDEQAHREAENREAAEEATEEAEEAEEAEEPDVEGEAADPESPTGAPEPGEPADPGAGGPSGGVSGEQVFVENGCGGCHTFKAVGTSAQIGPNLDESLVDRDAEFVRTAIVDPDADIAQGFGAGVMPADFGDQLTEAELQALVDFLVSNSDAQR